MSEADIFHKKVKKLYTMFGGLKKGLMKSCVARSTAVKRKEQVKEIESDCNEVEHFLNKYFDQVQHVTNILEQISSNSSEDTIASDLNTWNSEICKTNKDIEALPSETLEKLKRQEIISLVGQFATLSSELLILCIIRVPKV